MPRTLPLLFCFIVLPFLAGAQTDSLSKEDKALLDSMFRNDQFMQLFMDKDKSFVDISLSGTNQLFSLYNNNANAAQVQPRFVLIPAVAYYHKSGLGISGNVFLTTDSGQFKAYQYAISPFYRYQGKSWEASFMYTRYIASNTSELSSNPFKNDFYLKGSYRRTWIEPGIAIGLTTGRFTDTAVIAGTMRTAKFRISDFSLAVSGKHDFYFFDLLKKNDGISITPSVMLVAGRQRITAEGLNRFSNRPRVLNFLKNRFNSNSGFRVQSLAGSIDVKYQLKKFYFNPNVYFDYYLPETTQQRFTTVFSVTAGVML
jgi:hypothetical protein